MLQLSKTARWHTTSLDNIFQSRKQDFRSQTSTLSFAVKYIWSFSPFFPLLSLVCSNIRSPSDRDGLLSLSLRVTASPPSPPAAPPPVCAPHNGHRWWAEKKRGTMSMSRSKNRQTRTQNINRERGTNAHVLRSFTPGHRGVFFRVESQGGNTGEHLSLSAHTFIPCSAWHPAFLWHKSWFLHNRSPLYHGGEEGTIRIDSSPSSMLHPTFLLPAVTLNHYQTLLIWNVLDAR